MGDNMAGSVLASIGLLGGLSEERLRDLERQCAMEQHRAGEEVISRDRGNRDVYFVISGRVQVVNFSMTGREVAYAYVEAGEYFGEISAIDGQPRSAAVVAVTDCQIAALSPGAFADLLAREPSIAMDVLRKMARIVRICDERIMDLTTLGAHQRVYGELIRMAKPDPVREGSWMIWPAPTQAEIAALASTTRETVARVMSQLVGAGLLSRKGKSLYLRDLDRLKELRASLGGGLD